MLAKSPLGAAERIPVLMYHRIGEPSSKADRRSCVRPADFVDQMRALAEHGYTAVPLESFLAWLGGCTSLPRGAFVLTFDDGFRGVREHAFPLLRALGWPFTVFAVTAFIGARDFVTEDEILEMARNDVQIESHTRTHRRLPKLSDEELADELRGSKADLESLLGRPVHHLAYPFGESSARVVAATQEAGYKAAFSVQSGFNRHGVDPFQIRRLDVYGTDSAAQLLRKVQLGTNDGTALAELRYRAKRIWQQVSP
jgi:peptidoglycan/xylan/chitin deacetylase (PgdA/CDA1 family)